MAGNNSPEERGREWVRYVRSPDDEIVATARDYLWLAEFGPVVGRRSFELRRDAVVSEMEEQGLLEELGLAGGAEQKS